MSHLERVVRKDEEPDFYQLLKEAVFEDHNILEIEGVTWLIQSYDSEPEAKIVLIRQ